MRRVVKIVAPTGKLDFMVKLAVSLLLCGLINHFRHVMFETGPVVSTFRESLLDASFTALPMSVLALLLISHLYAVQKKLFRQSTVDALTQLTNRRWFMKYTPAEMEPGQILMIIDIDHFKRINDRFGHDIGDLCLKQMAIHLRISLGYRYTASRIGGEEFAAFLIDTTEEEAIAIANHISKGFTFNAGCGWAIRINASIGIAVGRTGQTRSEALREADQAVYQAKEKGRACFVIARPTTILTSTPSEIEVASDAA